MMKMLSSSRCPRHLPLWLFAAITAVQPLHAQVDRIVGKPFATRSAVLGRHGMVCTSVPAASQVGLDVLKRGGNAVDAAIAANATLGLMEPISNGVGGDLFAIVYSAKENKLYGLNGSGRSPMGLSYEQMREAVAKLNRNFLPPTGMLPINVPGAVDGWATLHDKFGRLPLADDLSGAIRYAEDGFPVTETIAYYWGRNLLAFKGLPGAWAETYHLPGTDRAPAEGDVFKNPGLAHTLRVIAEQGRDGFYKGEIADKIDAFMQANGGFLRKADFEAHHSEWVEPVSSNYRGYDIYELPGNAQGMVALQILNMLEGFDLRSMGFQTIQTFHTEIEAKKIAWADRAKYYADPAFFQQPVQGLLSKAYAAERRKLINPDHALPSVEAGNPNLNQGDTIYMCTADDEGNMVSLIQSNYRGMGSGISVPGLGFMFQDRGQLFTLEPGPGQRVRAGQAAFSHAHPGLRHEGRQAVAGVRRDGRRDAAAGARADSHGHDRLRPRRAGGGRRGALAARGQQRPDGLDVDRRRRGGEPEHDGVRRSGKCDSLRGGARAAHERARHPVRSRRLRRLPGDPGADARRPARLRRGQREPQGRAGGGVLTHRPETYSVFNDAPRPVSQACSRLV